MTVARRNLGTLLLAAVCFVIAAAPLRAESDLERAYRTIAGKKFVDLTHAFGPETPVWSGFGQAKFSPAADPKTHEPYTIAKDGFRATYYEMVGQYGTHVDPPAHFAENGVTMDQIPLKQMILRSRRPRRHAVSRQRSQPRLFGRGSQTLGTQAWPRAGRRFRRTAHRYVQGLGLQSRAFQAQPVSGLVFRYDQISLRAARRDRDRP